MDRAGLRGARIERRCAGVVDGTGLWGGEMSKAPLDDLGVEAIPIEWRQRLTMRAEIESLTDRLYDRAVMPGGQSSTSR